jgi:hypothetical protein
MNKKTSIKEDCRQKFSEVSFSVLSGITAGGALRGKRSLQDRADPDHRIEIIRDMYREIRTKKPLSGNV